MSHNTEREKLCILCKQNINPFKSYDDDRERINFQGKQTSVTYGEEKQHIITKLIDFVLVSLSKQSPA